MFSSIVVVFLQRRGISFRAMQSAGFGLYQEKSCQIISSILLGKIRHFWCYLLSNEKDGLFMCMQVKNQSIPKKQAVRRGGHKVTIIGETISRIHNVLELLKIQCQSVC